MSKLAIALSLTTTIQAAAAFLDVLPSSPLFLGSARGLRRQRALDNAFLLNSLYDDAWPVSPRFSPSPLYEYESLVPRFSSSPLEDLLQGGGRARRYEYESLVPRLRSLEYESLVPRFSSSPLEDLLQGGLGHPLSAGARWADKGEYVDAAVSLPRGFNADEKASLSAELDTEGDAHKVTIKGSRPGIHFSRSLSLPFPVSEAADIELAHHSAAGLLTLRLRKPADAPAPPTALPIKRVAEEEEPDKTDKSKYALDWASAVEKVKAANGLAAKLAPEDAVAASDTAEGPAGGERAALKEVDVSSREQQGEQQQVEQQEQLEEKFAFVKQAEAPKAAADPAAEKD